MTAAKPIEVAIIGGGCAGVTTAFELTRPEHRGKYNVTIYQMGWRLGGKGASGRGPAGRIEEHGLHLWMGFYENSFRLLRECYSELNRDPQHCPIASWRDAFTADPYVGVSDRLVDGSWGCWSAHFPAGSGEPGDPLRGQNPFTVIGYMQRSVALLRTLLESVEKQSPHSASTQRASSSQNSDGALPFNIQNLLAYGSLTTVAALIEALALLELVLEKLPSYPTQTVAALIATISRGAHVQIDRLVQDDDQLRQFWQMIDVVLACLHGSIRFNLMTHPNGFDAINDYDWSEWLKLNGAAESSVDSAFMRGIYDLLFAYRNGDSNDPQLAAGQALRGAVRMFMSYRGSVFWKMKAGMGDVVFAPYYEVLQNRGVKFRFFHRLENVCLAKADNGSANTPRYVEALDMTVQASTMSGEQYNPLVDVHGLPCWPSEPQFSQLADGPRLKALAPDFESPSDQTAAQKITLRVREDFDFVVLAIGFGAVPDVCAELIENNTRWKDAVANVSTVPTQAFQIWMNEDMASLGWPDEPINLSGFVTPFDTWADMTHLADIEDWRQQPKSIAYFCSVLAETDDQPMGQSRDDEVRNNAIDFLCSNIGHLWPDAVTDGGDFRWSVLIDPEADNTTADQPRDASRFDSQYWRANTSPSDRYVQSLPGTIEYRISPLDIDFDNLTVAGDWTDCSHNAGCVEAAVMSGRLAAHALSGEPPLEDIVGYDHP